MSTAERAPSPPVDLLERLCRALEQSEPGQAIRDVLAPYALSEAVSGVVAERAVLIAARARRREPRASACEVQLALGVMLVLCGALPQSSSGS